MKMMIRFFDTHGGYLAIAKHAEEGDFSFEIGQEDDEEHSCLFMVSIDEVAEIIDELKHLLERQ